MKFQALTVLAMTIFSCKTVEISKRSRSATPDSELTPPPSVPVPSGPVDQVTDDSNKVQLPSDSGGHASRNPDINPPLNSEPSDRPPPAANQPTAPEPTPPQPASVPQDAVWSANPNTCTLLRTTNGLRWQSCKVFEFADARTIQKEASIEVYFTCESLKTFSVGLTLNGNFFSLAPQKDPLVPSLKVNVLPVDGQLAVKLSISQDSFSGIQALKDPCYIRYQIAPTN